VAVNRPGLALKVFSKLAASPLLQRRWRVAPWISPAARRSP